jgi:pimeloyl-ACP methyl ester carboxylesterase
MQPPKDRREAASTTPPSQTIQFIETRRGRFAAAAQGPTSGPVVLCLHGFPDTPATFAALMAALAAAGYRAVAPWLRGYAPSPLDGEFGPEALAADLLALCEALGAERVIGHDWGALAVYAALEASAPLRAAVTLAVPRIQAVLRNLPQNPQQLLRSRYMLLFQLPGIERWLRARELSYIDELWRRWSPGLPLPAEHLAEVKQTLLDSGMAPLRHYRALPRTLRRIARHPPPSQTPLLYLAGADDGCMGVKLSHGQAALHGGRYTERIYPGAGHFLHLERPAEVAADIIAWLSAV